MCTYEEMKCTARFVERHWGTCWRKKELGGVVRDKLEARGVNNTSITRQNIHRPSSRNPTLYTRACHSFCTAHTDCLPRATYTVVKLKTSSHSRLSISHIFSSRPRGMALGAFTVEMQACVGPCRSRVGGQRTRR